MLKTLEEPPDFVHLLLLTDRREDVLATIASRCQPVRFDPLAAGAHRRRGSTRVADDRAQACARLALGDARAGRALGERAGRGAARGAEGFVRAALAGTTARAPVAGAARRRQGGRRERPASARRRGSPRSSSCCPRKERKRYEREGLDARRRASAARARRRSSRRCALGRAVAARRALRVRRSAASSSTRSIARRELSEDARGRRRASRAARAAIELVAGHAAAPVAERLRGARAGGARLPPAGAAGYGAA